MTACAFENRNPSFSSQASTVSKANLIDLTVVFMEQRHLFRTSRFVETDQNWNYVQSSMHLGNVEATGTFHVDNMLVGGGNLSNWNSALRRNEYLPVSVGMELTYPNAPIPSPSYLPLRHPLAARSFCPVTQNVADRPSSSSQYIASSSNHYGHLIHGYEEGTTSSGSGRGPHKRRRTAAPVVHERFGGYNGVGSSSDPSISFVNKPNPGSQHWPWEVVSVTSSSRGSNLSIVGEASQRNVRRRSTLDLDVSQARAHVLINPPLHFDSADRLVDHMVVADHANLGVSANTREWSHTPVSSDGLSRIMTGPSAFSHGIHQFHLGSNGTMSSMDIDSYRQNLSSIVPPPNMHFSGIQFSGTQAVRGVHSSYVQPALPACRVTRSYQRLGYVASSSERVPQSMSDSYSSSYSRPPSMIGWRTGERSGRLRIPYQRNSLFSGADAHARLGFVMEHSTLYDSRNLLDQHRDMRLDVDNMSYEELLALEERIGNVSTGLSEDTMSECLEERIHYSSDQNEEESSCVICLDEYKNKDAVATLSKCGHDYHTSCIKKWLSMKKVCPICKAPVLAEN